jgi:hypothetical protein
MSLNSSNDAARTATKRALAAAILALGALGGLALGEANAAPAVPLTPSIPIPPPSPAESSSSQASDVPVNDIKIGNRSQLSQSAGDPAPPNQQTSSAGRPQTLVFKIGRFVISPVK